MSASRWQRVEELFARALEQPLEQRAAYVAAAVDDPEVSGEVLSLLQAHEGRGRLDSIADQLHGLRPAAAALSLTDLLDRLRAALGGRYRVERELGRGGMAIVLLAEDLKHGRKVALKVLQPDLALGIGPVRFLQEIAIAAQLAHPHILPLHDSGEADGLLYYVMPYVEGESLRDRLRREGPLPVADALQIARQVADALSYAHRHDVIHRDIKPENILLEAGHAVVSDFGIARAMTAAAGDELGEAGIILGTPTYMSPEQAMGGILDGRSDLYSLGCVFYEMLAGEPPFMGATVEGVVHQHLADDPPPLSRPGLPAAVGAAVSRALAKTPGDRFATAAQFSEALPLPGAVAAPARRRLRAAVALVGAALATAAVLALPRSPVHPAASVMAVLPLVPTTPDTGLARLGRDLVVTLSANLDGAGKIRTVDALTVLAQTRQSGPLALEPGAELAGLLGASSFVHGAIARAGSNIRIDLGLFTTAGSDPVARASVTADPDDVTTITDSLSAALLRAVWRARAPPTPTLAAITTRSLPALQAFLEGERAGLENRWSDAGRAYARAMVADSTFWLAYWRYAYARQWYNDDVADAILRAIRAHRLSLPERDRLVYESWVTDTYSVALARGREAVERYPDYWPGWMQYADWLFHVGPVHGHEMAEAESAFERTVALNPALVAAWEHLYWATISHDTATPARALEALRRLGFDRTSIAEFGFDVSRVYRLELQVSSSGTLDRPLLDSIADDLIHVARGRIGSGANLPRAQVEISRRVLRAHPRAELAAVHERLLADAWAARGAWDSALVYAERYARRPASADPLDGYRLAVLGAWLGALPPDSAVRQRLAPALAAERRVLNPMWRGELAWLDGLLAAALRDRNALAAARARLHGTDTVTVSLLDRSLEGFDMELAGERGRAAGAVSALSWASPERLAPGYEAHPYLMAINRLAAARWLLAEGDTAEAVRHLLWFDAAWAYDGYRPARRVLAGLADRERARIAAAQGHVELARQRYAEFLRRYDKPGPAHRHLVDEARAAIQR
jgi:Protein kinase domain